MSAIRFVVGTIAVAALAVGTAACSDDKADTSASTTTAASTGAPGGAAPTSTGPATDETASSGGPSTTVVLDAGSKDDVLTPVIAEVLAAPVPALATDGKVHLAWELVLSNVVSTDVTIDSIVAMAGDTALQMLEGDALKGVMRPDGGSLGTTSLTPGQGALVWMEAVVDSYEDVPDAIEHAVSITLAQPNPPLLPPTLTEHIAPFAPVAEQPVVIGAPLAGGRWLDGNGCCALTPHRAAVSPINGRRWAAERWAIDFVRLDEANKLFDGPVDQLSSYAFEGADILAVADGPVVAMVSDRPEQTPGTTPTGLLIDEYGGNYIVQEIGDGQYAFYAHLVPDNPLGLAVGDQLTKGQVLGHLGNSGNSDAPHLHFHVMDRADPLAANGLPFLIESMEYEGRATSPAAVDEGLKGQPLDIDRTGAGPRPEATPLYLDVVGFPDTGATTRP
jgi:hypothetical protein